MKRILLLLSLCAIFFPVSSFAAYFKTGSSVFVNSSETMQDNVYAVGGNVAVSSVIDGDLFAAGSMLFISGKENGDIAVAGGTVNIAGVSAEDLRVIGGNVTIGGNFSGEIMAIGGQIMVTPDTKIKKDSHIIGGALSFGGNTSGNLYMSAGEIYINGTIEKNLIIKTAKKVTIGSGAVIKGNLEYSALSEAFIEDGAQIFGATTFHKIEKAGTGRKSGAMFGFLSGLFALSYLIKFLLILTATYLLWYIWRKDSADVVRVAKSHFGHSLFRGFVFLVVVPAAAIISFITIIGVVPGLFSLFLYAAILILSVPVATLFATSLLMKNRVDLKWFHILFGAAVMMVVNIIPFVGWIAVFIVYLAALGALLSVLRPKFQRSA